MPQEVTIFVPDAMRHGSMDEGISFPSNHVDLDLGLSGRRLSKKYVYGDVGICGLGPKINEIPGQGLHYGSFPLDNSYFLSLVSQCSNVGQSPYIDLMRIKSSSDDQLMEVKVLSAEVEV